MDEVARFFPRLTLRFRSLHSVSSYADMHLLPSSYLLRVVSVVLKDHQTGNVDLLRRLKNARWIAAVELARWLTSHWAGWLAIWLAGWLSGWLAGWLASWLVGWLASRLD